MLQVFLSMTLTAMLLLMVVEVMVVIVNKGMNERMN